MDNFCYLYGGRGSNIYNSVCQLDLLTIQWKELKDTIGDNPDEGRVGHTSCVYRRSLFIFGGDKHFNPK